MNTALYIARRYLFAKKSTNAINIISTISVLGVFVGSAALIIVLSVFNGFEDVVLKMFNTITPQLVIAPAEGKTFDPHSVFFTELKSAKEVYSFTEVLSENALLRYRDKQSVGMVKGVSTSYLKNKSLDSITVQGKFVLKTEAGPNAVIGSALQNYLMVNTNDPFTQLQVFSPKKGLKTSSVNPADDFMDLYIPVSGIFEVQQDFDNIAIVPLSFARKLLNEEIKVSSIELNLQKGVDPDVFKAKIAQQLGKNYVVKDRVEQNKALYNILSTEKWAVYIILTFILIIAIFNIIGSLTMLVIDKLKDIAILSSLGAGKGLIRKIFLFEGMMITLAGCVFGLFVGLVFCLLQQKFGLVKMSQENLLMSNAYPIGLKWKDFLLVFITVSIFSFMASALSSNLSVKNINHLNQDL
ncbi:lipoprotein-releasing system permease protein [Pedobacter cryoconitis]|uniref:Lipoprotein-releasing system permease protein n=1 Tax=Pedobacter cryoconitis TaxID=188932 RepID=A0A7W9DKT4_9SPHI|nr:ABC transporter permease [Pedobacter cryoconitis]MBB5622508.1 lipoprotein-releasing system permease protein [Pedobacter cryoconitis]MBB5647684.1 lipoprotein-releasing system permease protein [Pedobacter cryoconitis]